VLVLVLGFESG